MSKEELDGDEKSVRFSFETRIEFVVVVFFKRNAHNAKKNVVVQKNYRFKNVPKFSFYISNVSFKCVFERN